MDIRTETQDGVGWIIFDRPEVRNAARPQTMREACAAFDAYAADANIGAIALTGANGHFLAGGDFAFLAELADADGLRARDDIYTFFQGMTRRLFRCPKPTLAAISGAAITVGCEIALMCDVRIGDETAMFHESWIQVGLMPPLGGAMLLPRIVGLNAAKEIMLEAKKIRADEALKLGLLSEIVATDALRARAQERLAALIALPPNAYRATKEALHRGIESSMETEWSANVLAQALLIGSSEFKALVAAKKKR